LNIENWLPGTLLIGRLKVGLGNFNIFVKLWGLIIFNFILLVFLNPFPLMSKLLLGPFERVIVGLDILIFTEVSYKVIFWMSIIMRMKVLSVA
jgi:hypothetical protein